MLPRRQSSGGGGSISDFVVSMLVLAREHVADQYGHMIWSSRKGTVIKGGTVADPHVEVAQNASTNSEVGDGVDYDIRTPYFTAVSTDSYGIPIDGAPQKGDYPYLTQVNDTNKIIDGQDTCASGKNASKLPFLSDANAGDGLSKEDYGNYDLNASQGDNTGPPPSVGGTPPATVPAPGSTDLIVKSPKFNVNVDDKTVKIDKATNKLYSPVTPEQGSVFSGQTKPPLLVTSTSSKLSADISATDTSITLTDASMYSSTPLPFDLLIDGEDVEVTAISGNVLTVNRGENGTEPLAHIADADVTTAWPHGSPVTVWPPGNPPTHCEVTAGVGTLPPGSYTVYCAYHLIDQGENAVSGLSVGRSIELDATNGGLSWVVPELPPGWSDHYSVCEYYVYVAGPPNLQVPTRHGVGDGSWTALTDVGQGAYPGADPALLGINTGRIKGAATSYGVATDPSGLEVVPIDEVEAHLRLKPDKTTIVIDPVTNEVKALAGGGDGAARVYKSGNGIALDPPPPISTLVLAPATGGSLSTPHTYEYYWTWTIGGNESTYSPTTVIALDSGNDAVAITVPVAPSDIDPTTITAVTIYRRNPDGLLHPLPLTPSPGGTVTDLSSDASLTTVGLPHATTIKVRLAQTDPSLPIHHDYSGLSASTGFDGRSLGIHTGHVAPVDTAASALDDPSGLHIAHVGAGESHLRVKADGTTVTIDPVTNELHAPGVGGCISPPVKVAQIPHAVGVSTRTTLGTDLAVAAVWGGTIAGWNPGGDGCVRLGVTPHGGSVDMILMSLPLTSSGDFPTTVNHDNLSLGIAYDLSAFLGGLTADFWVESDMGVDLTCSVLYS